MKKAQIGAAAMALLLAAGLTACASEPTTTDTTTPQQQPVVDATDNTVNKNEDPEAPQETPDTTPEITVMDQPDQVTVAEDDKYLYTLAQIGGVTADGQYLIQVLHDFEPGETIDFRGMDLSQWAPTGEEFLLAVDEGVTFFVHDGEAWKTGKLGDLRADDYVYLTQDIATGEVYAITDAQDAAAIDDNSEPTDETSSDPADATTGDSTAEDAADAAPDANTADPSGDTTTGAESDDAVETESEESEPDTSI